ALELEKSPDDLHQLLSKILDRALHHGGLRRLAVRQQRVQLLARDLLARLRAERVLSDPAQRLAKAFENLSESALVGPVTGETVLILELQAVAGDIELRKAHGAVREQRRAFLTTFAGILGHTSPP